MEETASDTPPASATELEAQSQVSDTAPSKTKAPIDSVIPKTDVRLPRTGKLQAYWLPKLEATTSSWGKVIICVFEDEAACAADIACEKRLLLFDNTSSEGNENLWLKTLCRDSFTFDGGDTPLVIDFQFKDETVIVNPATATFKWLRDIHCVEIEIQSVPQPWTTLPLTVTGSISLRSSDTLITSIEVSFEVTAPSANSLAVDTALSSSQPLFPKSASFVSTPTKKLFGGLRKSSNVIPLGGPETEEGGPGALSIHPVGTWLFFFPAEKIVNSAVPAVSGDTPPPTGENGTENSSTVPPAIPIVPTELAELLKLLATDKLVLLKHSRNGRAVKRTVVSHDELRNITWGSEMFPMMECSECRKGTDADPLTPGETGTEVLRKSISHGARRTQDLEKSFSLIFKARTLDFTCTSEEQSPIVLTGFQQFLALRNVYAPPSHSQTSTVMQEGEGVSPMPVVENDASSAHITANGDTPVTGSQRKTSIVPLPTGEILDNSVRKSSMGAVNIPHTPGAIVTDPSTSTSIPVTPQPGASPLSRMFRGKGNSKVEAEDTNGSGATSNVSPHSTDASRRLSGDVIRKTSVTGVIVISPNPSEPVANTETENTPGGVPDDAASAKAELLERLTAGIVLQKHSRNGKTVERTVRSKDSLVTISWGREAYKMAHCIAVKTGAETLEFVPKLEQNLVDKTFSLVFPERSLDFTCVTAQDMNRISMGFRACLTEKA